MRIVESLPEQIRIIDHCWIPLRSGERLAARMWLPRRAEETPVPAILEYLPYRKRDYTAVRDQGNHAYLAGHGYACLRVDVRGTGDSDGIHAEQWSTEYEQDALDILDWIAEQPWSDGAVAMMGLSWGGNISLRMASLAPPQLKAVVAVSAADDRYTNKYLGGCLLLNTVVWSYAMVAQNSRPPDPETTGARWRDSWQQRLVGTVPYVDNWLGHQRKDAYWDTGSVVPRFREFGCPVFSVGGAADPGYAVTVPRLLANLEVPVKGLVGPWAHKYPHYAIPGPAVGYLQEVRRWFDRWLKNELNGVDEEPAYRVWMHEFAPPQGFMTAKPGHWVHEPVWPSPNVEPRSYALNPGRLEIEPGEETTIQVRTPQDLGLAAGEWMPWIPFGSEPELPTDQRDEDARSVTFDSPPLDERLEILGAPVATLELASDKPTAMAVVRLCDVAPDGTSVRVSYGALNLTRRQGLDRPRALKPGKRYRIEVPLYDIGYCFLPGHRIRVAVSSTYWPVLWPSPEEATLTLHTAASSIRLPIRRPRAEDADLPVDPGPEIATPLERTVLEKPQSRRTVTRDPVTGWTTLTQSYDGGRYRIGTDGLECGARTERRLSICDADPLSARAEVDWMWSFRRGDWRARTETAGGVTSDRDSFLTETRLEAFEGDERIFDRTWKNRLRRDLL